MGQLLAWTSIEGLKNAKHNRGFYAYSEKSKLNVVQISIPFSAINKIEQELNDVIEFYCVPNVEW